MRIYLIAVLALAGISSGCTTYTIIEPGHVGIKIEQTGHQRGVQDFPIQTGRVWYNPINENVLDYDCAIKQYTWTANLNEGKSVNEEMCFKSGTDYLTFCADVNAAFKIVDEKAPQFYVKFRNDNLDDFTHGFMRNVIRDALTKYSAQYSSDDLNGAKQDEFIDKVFEASKTELDTYGVQLIKLGFAHPPRPPKEIQDAITQKLKAVQDAITVENELRKTEAQAKKDIAEAEGQARANQIVTQSLTPQLLQMRALEKWNGVLPQATGGAVPFISVGGK